MGECYEGHFDVGRLANRDSKMQPGNPLRHLVLISAGTGFTPMPKLLQYFVAHAINQSVQIILVESVH